MADGAAADESQLCVMMERGRMETSLLPPPLPKSAATRTESFTPAFREPGRAGEGEDGPRNRGEPCRSSVSAHLVHSFSGGLRTDAVAFGSVVPCAWIPWMQRLWSAGNLGSVTVGRRIVVWSFENFG